MCKHDILLIRALLHSTYSQHVLPTTKTKTRPTLGFTFLIELRFKNRNKIKQLNPTTPPASHGQGTLLPHTQLIRRPKQKLCSSLEVFIYDENKAELQLNMYTFHHFRFVISVNPMGLDQVGLQVQVILTQFTMSHFSLHVFTTKNICHVISTSNNFSVF